MPNSSNQATPAAASSSSHSWFAPWWPEDHSFDGAFHVRAALSGGRRGILVDTGAHDNLAGASWIREQAHEAAKHGLKSTQNLLNQPKNVAGVGHGSQTAKFSVKVPTIFKDEKGRVHCDTYTAPALEGPAGDNMPALLGAKSLRRNEAIIDCGKGKIHFPGPGGVRMELPPGTTTCNMEISASGHWFIPVNEFENTPSSPSTTSQRHLFTGSQEPERRVTWPSPHWHPPSGASGSQTP